MTSLASASYDGLMDVTLVLTHDCNLGCSYCYAGRKFRRSMGQGVRDQALNLAFSSAPARGKVQISYFGGEPTLEWDTLIDSVHKAREMASARDVALTQTMTTNGTTLTAERVAELANAGVYVALSIDGVRSAHEAHRPTMNGKSSFDDVIRGLDLLLAQGAPFETISVLTPETAADLGTSVAFLFERGVPRVSINPAYEAVWTDAALAQLKSGYVAAAQTLTAYFRAGRVVSFPAFDGKIIARLKGGLATGDTCAIGEGSVAVAPSGNIYPCERLVGEDEDLKYVIGHVDRGIDEAQMRKHRDALPDHHATNDECNDCSEKSRCGAFCACANIAETGDISVAGGVQCLIERITMEIADAVLETLVAEGNQTFAEWFQIARVASHALLAESASAPRAVAGKRRLPMAKPR
jgi:uncharacterized protein